MHRHPRTVLTALAAALVAAFFVLAPPAQAADTPLPWAGGFDVGGVPHGSNGSSCGTGSADGPDSAADQYSSVQEMGNTNCTSSVAFVGDHLRTADSRRALRIVIGPNQQREALASKLTWTPDGTGRVDQWYGWSMMFGSDWKLSELAHSWDDPISWRTTGANGSLNFSIDTNSTGDHSKPQQTYSTPHLSLRRNTVRNQQGFYGDGLGLDKIDMGPVVVGQWMDFVCHIRWSTTSSNAYRACWRGGKLMGERRSLNAVDSKPHHWRIEQYQDTNIPHPRTSWYDNVSAGTSYAQVDPSRGGTAPTTATTGTSSGTSSAPAVQPAAPAAPAPVDLSQLFDPVVPSTSAPMTLQPAPPVTQPAAPPSWGVDWMGPDSWWSLGGL